MEEQAEAGCAPECVLLERGPKGYGLRINMLGVVEALLAGAPAATVEAVPVGAKLITVNGAHVQVHPPANPNIHPAQFRARVAAAFTAAAAAAAAGGQAGHHRGAAGRAAWPARRNFVRPAGGCGEPRPPSQLGACTAQELRHCAPW